MQALSWDGQKLSFNASYPTPLAGPDRALVKVHFAGICSTDLQIVRGYMGFSGIPGHEFVGSVYEGPQELLGRRVVGEINFACGRCDYCSRGLGRHCPSRTVMGIVGANGAFAEFASVPLANFHLVPDNVSDEEAVFAEPLAAAFEIVGQVDVNTGDEVLVIGDGKLGNLCAQVMRLTGASVTALGKHENKLELIKRAGVRPVLLREWSPRLFDIVVEASGSPSGLKLAMGAVRPRGTLVLKTTIAQDHQLSLAPLVINEITVVGSRCGPFAAALAALQERSVVVRPLVEKIYPLKAGIEALAHAANSGARKILLRMN